MRKTRLLAFVAVAWSFGLIPSAVAGTPDGGRPIPGAPPGTIDVAELLPGGTDSEIPVLPNPSGLRCGAVGSLVPLFILAVLTLYGCFADPSFLRMEEAAFRLGNQEEETAVRSQTQE